MIGNIYITGQIGSFDEVVGVELVDVISQVKKQPEATEFNVHINSEGGVVDIGFDIYEYLTSLKKPIHTIGSGIVASIATVIFMAGTSRQVRENTPFMIHLPWGGSMGTADELEKYTDELRGIEKKLIGFYKDALQIEESAIVPLLRNETWLTPQNLSDLGFTTTAQVKAVAKTYFKPNSNMNTLTEKDKDFFTGLFEKILGKSKKDPIVNKVVLDGTGTELDFTDVANDAAIEVGMKATVDGKPADGEYTMPDGSVYVFAAGELKEIKPTEEEESEDAAALATANEEIEKLKGELATEKAAVANIKKDVEKLRTQIFSKFNVDGKKENKGRKAGEVSFEERNRAEGAEEYLNKKRGL